MNIYDVVPVTKISTDGLRMSPIDLVDRVRDTLKLCKSLDVPVPAQLILRANDQLYQERRETFQKNGYTLHPLDGTEVQLKSDGSMKISQDVFIKLTASPKAKIEEVRGLADALGMVIMPYQALTSKSLAAEKYDVREAVSDFCSAAEIAGMDTYVVAPIQLYDIHKHVKMDGNAPSQFYSAAFQQVFLSIQLQLPLFRSILGTLDNLTSRVTELEGVTNQIKGQVAALQVQLDSMKRDHEIRRMEEARKSAPKSAEVLRKKEAPFHAADPMIFAVAGGSSLLDNSINATLGPVWGPEFDPELATAFGLKLKRGQRTKLEYITKENWLDLN